MTFSPGFQDRSSSVSSAEGQLHEVRDGVYLVTVVPLQPGVGGHGAGAP